MKTTMDKKGIFISVTITPCEESFPDTTTAPLDLGRLLFDSDDSETSIN
jgi:hypothetical protein